MAAEQGPLIAIVGETASGKSAAAIKLAKEINGEIICADSRTIYLGMDIGTAKPTLEEQKLVPHYLLDIVEPKQPFTVAEFKRLAQAAIDDIQDRGKLPILVGGSGLYIDSVIFDYQFDPKDSERDDQNPRHRKHSQSKDRQHIRPNTIIIGLSLPPEVLKQRITKRVDEMVERGLIDEIKRLHDKYGEELLTIETPGYKAFREYIKGSISLDEAKALFIKNDMQLAKKQRTWFRRNKRIQWLTDPSKIVDIATTELNKLD